MCRVYETNLPKVEMWGKEVSNINANGEWAWVYMQFILIIMVLKYMLTLYLVKLLYAHNTNKNYAIAIVQTWWSLIKAVG